MEKGLYPILFCSTLGIWMRLKGLRALITGGSGGIGQVIAKRYLEEGAEVIITGRNQEKLKQVCSELAQYNDRIHFLNIDGADINSLNNGVEEVKKRIGTIDILINNAGSAGPMQTLSNIPLTQEELQELNQQGSKDSETISQAIGSLLGAAWNTTNAFLPLLSPGAVVINNSTIFSKTNYYGRTAYVVPKAALNMLSHLMAEELANDPAAVRLNIIYPGPVIGERIDKVFLAMDKLKQVDPGTTSQEVITAMTFKAPSPELHYLSKEEIAETVVFLGSKESSGFYDHNFEITHGLHVDSNDSVEMLTSLNPASVNLGGYLTWIIAGDQVEDACFLAQKHYNQGSEILLTFSDPKSLVKAEEVAKTTFKEQVKITFKLFNPSNLSDWDSIAKYFVERLFYPNTVFILPHESIERSKELYGDSLIHLPLEKIKDFCTSNIVEPVIIANRLSKLFKSKFHKPRYKPAIVFITNGSDGKGNKLAKIRSSAIHQLIRTWRHELQFEKLESTPLCPHILQLIRYTNEERSNLDFACDLTLFISDGTNVYSHIDIFIGKTIQNASSNRYRTQKFSKLLNDVTDKIALITGGSEGIGRETARILLEGGARVAIASRSKEKLEHTRSLLIRELTARGFPVSEEQLHIIICDVTEKNLEPAFNEVIDKFGRIDFLINNAGITGQEQTVVDMSVEGWNETMQANLISNYDLMMRSLPFMKRQRGGHIICMSSQLSGVHYATPSYPNRADYSASKAGQQALTEAFSILLGPEVQINAIAPGPVEGDRLRGSVHKPGLFHRRAKINYETKRLNLVYAALVEIRRLGGDLKSALEIISKNDVDIISKTKDLATPIQNLLNKIPKSPVSMLSSGSETHLLTRPIAEKLIKRLRLANLWPQGFTEKQFFESFSEPKESFISDTVLADDAISILNKTLNTLSLGHMPSEYDIGREIALTLADKSITGETIFPSCGLTLDQVSMKGDFVGTFYPVLLDYLQIPTVMIIGDSMYSEMALIAASYSKGNNVGQVIVVVGSMEGKEKVEVSLAEYGKQNDLPLKKVIVRNESLANYDNTLDRLFEEFNLPDVLISIPLGQLPNASDNWEDLPNVDEFSKIMNEQISNHFQIARRGSLIDNCRVFIISPAIPPNPTKQALAFAKFIQDTLAPLCVTAAHESSRLIHQALFFQLDCNHHYDQKTYQGRLVDALLLLSLPNDKAPKIKYPMQSGIIMLV